MTAYLASQAVIALFGVPVILHPMFRRESWPLRVAVAFIAGAVILTTEAIILSLAGISWGERTLPLPVIAAGIVLAWRWRKLRADRVRLPLERPSAVSAGVIIVAVLQLVIFTLFNPAITSYDATTVVGAKAARMAEARGLMMSWRAQSETAGLRPSDPPLPEVTRAWSNLVLGRETWGEAAATDSLWFLVGLTALVVATRRTLGDRPAWVTAAFWAIALSNAIVIARAAGGAEVAFLVVTTAAAMSLHGNAPALRMLACWSLAAMALTRPEGVLYALVLVVFSRAEKKLTLLSFPLAAASLWFVPAAAHGVLIPSPLILFSMHKVISVTSFGAAVALPLMMMCWRARGSMLDLARVAAFALGVPLAAALMRLPLYVPEQPYPARAMLPLLSVVIVSGAVATFRPRPLAGTAAAD